MKTEYCFDEVIGRIKKALKIKNDYEFAERINMKPTTFNSRKKANSLPFDEIIALANTEKLDFNWLLTGEGEMLRGKPIATVDMKAAKMAELLEGLNEDQQREIFTVIEEKKRLNELEEIVFQLQKKVG